MGKGRDACGAHGGPQASMYLDPKPAHPRGGRPKISLSTIQGPLLVPRRMSQISRVNRRVAVKLLLVPALRTYPPLFHFLRTIQMACCGWSTAALI